MRTRTYRLVSHIALLSAVATTSAVGCVDASVTPGIASGDEANLEASKELEADLLFLGGSAADLRDLRDVLTRRIVNLEQQKKDAKKQAANDVASYTPSQWERSYFDRDEVELAVEARADDIFDRPERRALNGARAQKQIVDELLPLVASGQAGDLEAPSERARFLRESYVEIAVSVALNANFGVTAQGGARVGAFLRSRFPWLGLVFGGLRRDRRVEGIEGEAVNIDRSGPADELWKKNPSSSTVWHPRSPEEITPEKLYAGPWFAGKTPRLPAPGETWKLDGFRSRKADGAHPGVDVSNGKDKVKVKFRTPSDIFEEGPNARLLWAMGYETDPQYIFRDVRIEARAFVAAFTTNSRAGISWGPGEDTIVPGRPPREGLSIAMSGMRKTPGPDMITLHFKDGHAEVGEAAIESLKRATDDRPFLDAMESVDVARAYGEVAYPTKREATGPWDFDADNHVDDREIRAIGILFGAWLGCDDIKFNNVRLDVVRPADGSFALRHTLSDSGDLARDATTKVGFTVDIDPQGRFLHPDTNGFTIRSFYRITTNDARWATARIASLSEDQILASYASGSWSDAALALHVEKLVARRDSLVKTFGLEKEFALLRPNGPNPTPAPRRYHP